MSYQKQPDALLSRSLQNRLSGLGCYRGLFMLWLCGLKEIKKTPTHSSLSLLLYAAPADPTGWVDTAASTRAVMVTREAIPLILGCEREGESTHKRWSRPKQWLNSSGETLDTVLREFSRLTQLVKSRETGFSALTMLPLCESSLSLPLSAPVTLKSLYPFTLTVKVQNQKCSAIKKKQQLNTNVNFYQFVKREFMYKFIRGCTRFAHF